VQRVVVDEILDWPLRREPVSDAVERGVEIEARLGGRRRWLGLIHDFWRYV
jgi:hypothetical protein